MSSMNDDLPPVVERRLNGLLTRWATTHRLRDRQADAIRRAILTMPGLPDFEWWWNLLDPVNGVAFRGSQGHQTFATIPPLPVQTWTSAFVDPDAWHQHDAADYQPYLRLA
jgi:hypothetical protein